jgi:RNA polymerase sigma-70 factor (ECF subfamily)
LDEKQLIARVLAGDAAAERALYDAHVDRVYRLAYRLAGEPSLAEDFTQETFLRAFDRLPGFRGDAALSTWLHAIAVSVAINGLRKVRRYREREVGCEDLSMVSDRRFPEDIDLKRRLGSVIDGLSESLRVVFVMHDVEGYKHREISAALGVPEGTTKARLSRARKALREALSHVGAADARRVEA